MRRRHLPALALAFGLVLLVSACSDSGTDIAMKSLLDPMVLSGTFVATGGAVASGDICPEGDFGWGDSDQSGDPWWFEETYVCEDGSGSFTLRAEFDAPQEGVESDLPEGSLEGTWTVVAGSGGYTDLDGNGRYAAWLLGTPIEENYTGDLARP
jgi:hypothetical protein